MSRAVKRGPRSAPSASPVSSVVVARSSETRQCRKCQQTRPITAFPLASWVDGTGTRRTSPRRVCADCKRLDRYRWVLTHPGNVAAWKATRQAKGPAPYRVRDRARNAQERRDTLRLVQGVIRALRARGFTDVAIAAAAGVQRQTIANWARLTRPPRQWRQGQVRQLFDFYVETGGAS